MRERLKSILGKTLFLYIFSNGKDSVVFEYKTFIDFTKSVREGRIFDQAIRQVENFKYHFIILEAKKNDKQCNLYNEKTYCEAIANLNTFTTVIICPTMKLAIKMMEKQAESCLEPHPLTKRPVEKLDNVAYNYLLLIRGIDKVRAHTICRHLNLESYDYLKNITTKRLTKVPGIGSMTAQRITTAIHFD